MLTNEQIDEWFADIFNGAKMSKMAKAVRAQAKLANSGGEVVAWIPVSERLPDGFCNVIYANVLGTVGETHSHTIRHCFKDAKRNDEECVFTHWQPLPPSPVAPR